MQRVAFQLPRKARDFDAFSAQYDLGQAARRTGNFHYLITRIPFGLGSCVPSRNPAYRCD